ncbi:hypothetical protein RB653_006405 [Dictyostelium firmibasis]|uniref:Uncharacterized protein n=1 Tax=Dictyostelium firmibasis TaxID=79012 RepID=A0AAN7UDC7_9MYCE
MEFSYICNNNKSPLVLFPGIFSSFGINENKEFYYNYLDYKINNNTKNDKNYTLINKINNNNKKINIFKIDNNNNNNDIIKEKILINKNEILINNSNLVNLCNKYSNCCQENSNLNNNEQICISIDQENDIQMIID